MWRFRHRQAKRDLRYGSIRLANDGHRYQRDCMNSACELLNAQALGRVVPGTEQWLLRNVSLSVCAGECLAIVGRTGSGKTLLLRSLALLDAVDEGQVRWHGQPIAARDVPTFRRHVIYLHQRAA